MATFFVIPDPDVLIRSGPWAVASFCNIGAQNEQQSSPTFRLLFATALNSNTVRVYLSAEPRHVGPLGSADVLNRDNWELGLVSAGDPKVVEPEIGKLENVQFAGDFLVASGIAEPNAFSVDIRTARRLANQDSTFRVVASTAIEDKLGTYTIPPDPYDRDDFPGVMVVRTREARRPARERQAREDLHYDFFAGTYRLDQSDDLGLHSGDDALKKRIIRRILTSPGQFRHLERYGVGRVDVKKLFDATRLGELRLAVIRQVKEEEEVSSVSVDASFTAGVLFLAVTVGTIRGRLSFAIERSADGEFTVV